MSEYYHQSGGYTDLHTLPLRGLPRPEDNRHIRVSPWSDPVYAVWATRV